MQENYKPIGDYIRVVNLKNRDLAVKQLVGLSIDKCYIPSVANVIGTDLSTYKIIKRNQFACSLMQVSRDEKIPIACMMEYDEAIMSPAYVIFEIIDESALMPEYLNMWVMRAEFDREASFLAVGGVRGSLAWDDFCRMKLPVPSIDEQRKIVKAYQTITDRIKLKKQINDNLANTLEATFLNLYQSLDEDSAVNFSDVCSLASSKRVFAEDYVECGIPFYRGKEITQKRDGEPISDPLYISREHFISLKKKYGIPTCGDILITAVGTIGNSYLVQNEEFYFKDGNIIWLKDFIQPLINFYLYDYMQTSKFRKELDGISIGSTQTALTIVSLSKLKIKIPNSDELNYYCEISKAIRDNIQNNNLEIEKLTQVVQSLLSSLSY